MSVCLNECWNGVSVHLYVPMSSAQESCLHCMYVCSVCEFLFTLMFCFCLHCTELFVSTSMTVSPLHCKAVCSLLQERVSICIARVFVCLHITNVSMYVE